jgi:hypothetical protein
MLIAAMEDAGDSVLFSYDHGFDRIPAVARQTP